MVRDVMTKDVINSGIMGVPLGGIGVSTVSAVIIGFVLATIFAILLHVIKGS